jgi:hypothetical protein
MIQINVFNQADFDASLFGIALKFIREHEAKSYSGRHPELGKMISCYICERRHRVAQVCTPVYATYTYLTVPDDQGNPVPKPMMAAQNTKKGVMGAKSFKGRIIRHRNAWGLQVLERATKLYRMDISSFPNASQEEQDKMGKSALSRALNEKRAERAARRKSLFQITRESRRINTAA